MRIVNLESILLFAGDMQRWPTTLVSISPVRRDPRGVEANRNAVAAKDLEQAVAELARLSSSIRCVCTSRVSCATLAIVSSLPPSTSVTSSP
eukprot:CAMPEP_0172794112 /NCGR_PEP_ID=MMETSP1074-20121228/209816_1 /TAXON_ID=2916 /ORGANISM="Ceratium fusus, Strain PA161109" /LENGTH=91 /DNA_ID=CAMNT_0013631189 /DNA_START=976 /DNA_END=1249 /DNA_ORIENTATION=+